MCRCQRRGRAVSGANHNRGVGIDGAARTMARVLRGGSWINNPDNARAANRNRNHPDNRNDNVGFRLCCGPTSTRPLVRRASVRDRAAVQSAAACGNARRSRLPGRGAGAIDGSGGSRPHGIPPSGASSLRGAFSICPVGVRERSDSFAGRCDRSTYGHRQASARANPPSGRGTCRSDRGAGASCRRDVTGVAFPTSAPLPARVARTPSSRAGGHGPPYPARGTGDASYGGPCSRS